MRSTTLLFAALAFSALEASASCSPPGVVNAKSNSTTKGSRRHHKHHHRKHHHHHHKNHTSSPAASAPAASSETATALPHLAAQVSSAISAASSSAPTATSSAVPAPAKSAPPASYYNLPSTGITVNGVAVGFLPDDGSGGGTSETMAQINSALGLQSATYGYYAQAQSGTPFDGSQLLYRMDDIKAAGGVFQPAVMPTGGWQGLTYADNSQAINIAKVMKKFTDEGLEVWLRFAHEVNYYQTDGTYTGGASDFKEGWAVVAAAVKEYAPAVKMWFTPNVADLNQYDSYYPDDPTTVDLIGIDYYPQDTSNLNFLATMQPFHDKYTSEKTKFAIGETGLGGEAPIATRLAWLTDATSAATASGMPHYVALSWFNYQKGYNFKVAATSGDSVTASYLKNFQN